MWSWLRRLHREVLAIMPNITQPYQQLAWTALILTKRSGCIEKGLETHTLQHL